MKNMSPWQMIPLAMAMLTSAPAIAQSAGAKPNIVLILADNLGYGEIGPYGGGVTRGAPTPRLDELAREGTKLTNSMSSHPARRAAPR
jgi:arylsulfatase A-like enzyme